MPRVLERIANQLDAIDVEALNGDQNDRLNLLLAARALCQRLETPEEFMQRVTSQEPSLIAALKIADDIDLFKHLTFLPQSIQTLALRTDSSPQLLKRVVRHLATHNIVSEVLTANSPLENGISSRRPSLRIESRKNSRSNSIRIESRKNSRSNSFIGAIGTAISNISSNISSGKNTDIGHIADDMRVASPSISPVPSTESCPSLAALDAEVHYVATTISSSLATPQASASIRALTDVRIPVLQKLPKFLAQAQYDDVRDARHGPFQAEIGKGTTYHEWFQNPENVSLVHNHTDLNRVWKQGRSWIDIFNPGHLLSETVKNNTEDGTNGYDFMDSDTSQSRVTPSRLLFVDVSAGQTSNAILFRQHFCPASFPGIVELLAPKPVIRSLANDLTLGGCGITLVAHNILTSALKPHSAASCLYLLDSVLQSHPDSDAKRILGNIASGMLRGWSRLLICDFILPERNCSDAYVSGLDLCLMALCAGRIRTETEWRDLIEQVTCDGESSVSNREKKDRLKIVAIHILPHDQRARAVIECELV